MMDIKNLTNMSWHSFPLVDILKAFSSEPDKGLSAKEVEERRVVFGLNIISYRKGKGVLIRFLLQFHQPLVYILIVSGVITAALGEWVDSSVIFGVVLVNAIIGFVQESKAVNALAALSKIMTSEATVIRDGEKQRILSQEIVPGDIVFLQSGDKVPADMRLISVRQLQVNESALTGEAVPVGKTDSILPQGAILAEQSNMVFATSLVTFGQALGVVVATGDNTEVGRISKLVSDAEELATPLTKKIASFSNLLLYVIIGLAVFLMVVGIMRGQPFFEVFMAAVALAVGAIPEGLPAAVTITLAIGVSRMARRRAIIRKLPAVETLGSTTVICSDKTGTLTENQMTVQTIFCADRLYRVTGTGYAPLGEFVRQDGIEGDNIALLECLKAGVLCNDSRIVEEDGLWQVHGDPTEGALLVSAAKAGFDDVALNKTHRRIDSLPFESEHQYMATMHQTEDGKRYVYLKGAAEVIISRCSNQLDESGVIGLEQEKIAFQLKEMASEGLRVLAFARLTEPIDEKLSHESLMHNLTFLGLQAMMDPPRKEAIQAVAMCHKAGIQVKMITGDHAVTASAIAKQIGLHGQAHVQAQGQQDDGAILDIGALTGHQIATMSSEELRRQAEVVSVFARVSPEQKLRLVEALQSNGHIVAMTGDGVNDAPALKKADIGIAMGKGGTEVAREAADMILTDDNFSSIEAAVEEGRGVFDNLTKFIVWTLPTNLGEGLVILAAILFGVTLPILPVQILWINMTTAGFLGLMLAFEPKEAGIMLRAPRAVNEPILTKSLSGRILLVGGLLLIFAFGLFNWELSRGATLTQARTVAVNSFVVMELFYLFNCRCLKNSLFSIGLFSNIWVWIGSLAMFALQIAYTYLPVMQKLFHSTSIGLSAWVAIVSSGLAVMVIVEIEKWVKRRK